MNEKKQDKAMNQRRSNDPAAESAAERDTLSRASADHKPDAHWKALLEVYPAHLFHLRLVQEIARSERYRHFLGIILVHVERLASSVGDTDVTLQKVGRDLTKGLSRRTDILCQYQRAQFVVLLPETDTMGTQIVINRFRAMFPENDCRFHYRSISYPEDASSLETIMNQIKDFSSEMYRKHSAMQS